MSVVVVTPPEQIVGLDLAKQHLRVDGGDDDTLIAVYIAAAQAMIDGPSGWLGRAIGKQTLEYRFDGFAHPIWGWDTDGDGLFWGATPPFNNPCFSGASGRVELPYPPLISVQSVTYKDASGNDQDLPSSDYLATDEGLSASYGTTFPAGRWAPNAVRVRYQAGYDTIPPAIIAATLLMIGDLYSNRETTLDARGSGVSSVPMSTTVQALLGPYRVFA